VNGFIGQAQDAVANLRILFCRVLAGKKGVVGVESGVKQVLPIEFLKQHSIQQKCRGLGIARMRVMDSLE